MAGVAVFGAGVLAAVAFAGNTPPPGFQAAVQACAAKGLKQGTDAFAQCVNQQLGGAPPPPGGRTGPNPPPPPPQQTATGQAPTPSTPAGKAAQQCIAQGAKPGSADLSSCVQRMLLAPKQRQAYDACVAQGKAPGAALSDCVAALLQASSSPQLTPQQRDDVDYCLGLGKVQGTPEFAACIRTAGNRALTPAQQAAVDTCQKQGLGGQALVTCVGGLLTVKVPVKSTVSGPGAAAVQAAFDACIAQKLKPRTDAFQACVTAKLKAP